MSDHCWCDYARLFIYFYNQIQQHQKEKKEKKKKKNYRGTNCICLWPQFFGPYFPLIFFFLALVVHRRLCTRSPSRGYMRARTYIHITVACQRCCSLQMTEEATPSRLATSRTAILCWSQAMARPLSTSVR